MVHIFGKETYTPKDFYVAPDFTFSITQDESEITEIAKKVKNININNEQMESYLKLIKKDADSGKIVTLNTTTFQIQALEDIIDRGNGKIIYKKGDIIKQKVGSMVYDTFTTNAENLIVPVSSYNSKGDPLGAVVTPLKVQAGKYKIIEKRNSKSDILN